MTLNGRTALYCTNDACFGAHYGNLKEDKPILVTTQCSPWTLLSDNIRLMQIFVEVLRWGGLKRTWSGQNRRHNIFGTFKRVGQSYRKSVRQNYSAWTLVCACTVEVYMGVGNPMGIPFHGNPMGMRVAIRLMMRMRIMGIGIKPMGMEMAYISRV